MTAPTRTLTEPAATPTAHTPWCQPQHCAAHPGMDATHVHVIGEVAGVQVRVERADITRADGSHEYGTPGVHIWSEGHLPLRSADLEALRKLTTVAEVFADEIVGVR